MMEIFSSSLVIHLRVVDIHLRVSLAAFPVVAQIGRARGMVPVTIILLTSTLTLTLTFPFLVAAILCQGLDVRGNVVPAKVPVVCLPLRLWAWDRGR
jgi:hypothetical protein